jgi:DNA-binding NtrC family response regulator
MLMKADTTTVRDLSRSSGHSRSLDVLVVDDEPLIRWSLRQALADRGHTVTTAGTGREALAALASGHGFDVVVLDYRLPDRQDLSLLDEVRYRSPESAVFMMTAYGDESMRAGAHDRGVRDVVDKPFQVKSFVAMIEQSLA